MVYIPFNAYKKLARWIAMAERFGPKPGWGNCWVSPWVRIAGRPLTHCLLGKAYERGP
jgi:hypothetical protein